MNRFAVALSFASCVALAFAAGCSSSSTTSGGNGGSGGGGGGGGGCSKTTTAGTVKVCDSYSSNVPDFECSSEPGFASGSCPSSGLFGCCVTTTSDGSYSVTTASCYYDKTTGMTEMTDCTGAVGKWQTTAP
jgi:hypothetical protein